MTDWKGLFEEFSNTVYNNMPPWMRKQGPSMLIKMYDNYFQPISSEFMPRVAAPAQEGGRPVSPRTPFSVPVSSDPQGVSQYVDFGERPTKRKVALRRELYSASMIMEDGPEWNPMEFADEWNDEFLNFRNQFLLQSAIQNMNRKVEYDNISYIFGKNWALNRFSPGISTDRKKSLAANSDLTGTSWSTKATADPIADLSEIRFYSREINAREARFGYIGNYTKFSLENNARIQNVMQYTTDYTNAIIGTRIGGIDFKYVGGLTYKNVGSGRPSMPIVGDVRETTWTRDNRTRFMTHVDGSTFEWGLFLPGNVGSTMMARCHPDHTNVMSPYVHSWMDEEHQIRKTRMKLSYVPFIDDWADVMVVTHLAERP